MSELPFLPSVGLSIIISRHGEEEEHFLFLAARPDTSCHKWVELWGVSEEARKALSFLSLRDEI